MDSRRLGYPRDYGREQQPPPPRVRTIVGGPGAGKTTKVIEDSRYYARNLWIDPGGRERMEIDGIPAGGNAAIITEDKAAASRAMWDLGSPIWNVVYRPTGTPAEMRADVSWLVTRAREHPKSVHIIVDEFRLLVGRHAASVEGLDAALRRHRHDNVTIDLISHRYQDIHPDAAATGDVILIYGARTPTDRRRIVRDFGKDVLAAVDALDAYTYLEYDLRTGRRSVGGARK